MKRDIILIMIPTNIKSLEFARLRRENAKLVSQSQEDNSIEEDVDGHSQPIPVILRIELKKIGIDKSKRKFFQLCVYKGIINFNFKRRDCPQGNQPP